MTQTVWLILGVEKKKKEKEIKKRVLLIITLQILIAEYINYVLQNRKIIKISHRDWHNPFYHIPCAHTYN